MPSHRVDYSKAHTEADEHKKMSKYVDAVVAYRRARGALNNEIVYQGKEKSSVAGVLKCMLDQCFVDLNIVDCYQMQTPQNAEIMLEYAIAVFDFRKSINALVLRIEDACKEVPQFTCEKKLLAHLKTELKRAENLFKEANVVQVFIGSVFEISDTVITREQCRQIIKQLAQSPNLCLDKDVMQLGDDFVNAVAKMYENTADVLVDFSDVLSEHLDIEFKGKLLKAAYECYEKQKIYLDSESAQKYYTVNQYKQKYLNIVSSLAFLADKFVRISENTSECLDMLYKVAEYLRESKDIYKTTSLTQFLVYVNYQCCVEYNILVIKRKEKQDYDFSRRVLRVLGYVFDFSRKLKGLEQQLKTETVEVVRCYDQIVKDFLLAKINDENCNASTVDVVISSIIKCLQARNFNVVLQSDKLASLIQCGHGAISSINQSKTVPAEALKGFIEELLLQKDPTALVQVSELFIDVAAIIVASKEKEIAKVFTDFTAYIPKLQSSGLPSSSQVTTSAVSVSVNMAMAVDPSVSQVPNKKRVFADISLASSSTSGWNLLGYGSSMLSMSSTSAVADDSDLQKKNMPPCKVKSTMAGKR